MTTYIRVRDLQALIAHEDPDSYVEVRQWLSHEDGDGDWHDTALQAVEHKTAGRRYLVLTGE